MRWTAWGIGMTDNPHRRTTDKHDGLALSSDPDAGRRVAEEWLRLCQEPHWVYSPRTMTGRTAQGEQDEREATPADAGGRRRTWLVWLRRLFWRTARR